MATYVISDIHGDLELLSNWVLNGADSTIREFAALNAGEKRDVIGYLREFSVSEELFMNGTVYWLIHAGIDHFSEEKRLHGNRNLELSKETVRALTGDDFEWIGLKKSGKKDRICRIMTEKGPRNSSVRMIVRY